MSEWTNCANCGKRLKVDTGWCDPYCMDQHAITINTGAKGTKCERTVVNDDETWNGTWEHITSEPVTITGGRRELLEVCRKHGVAPKALLKPKSQGKGYEPSNKRF